MVPAFLDGQIAHGGRLGMLGEQKAMDVPFNVIGYTSKLIQDQQAKNYRRCRQQRRRRAGRTGATETSPRPIESAGFKLDGDDMTMGGLAGVVPRQVMDSPDAGAR